MSTLVEATQQIEQINNLLKSLGTDPEQVDIKTRIKLIIAIQTTYTAINKFKEAAYCLGGVLIDDLKLQKVNMYFSSIETYTPQGNIPAAYHLKRAFKPHRPRKFIRPTRTYYRPKKTYAANLKACRYK